MEFGNELTLALPLSKHIEAWNTFKKTF